MTDQVEAELKSLGTQALQDLMNNLTQAKTFVLGQAPEFCQQLIARKMVCLSGWCLWGAVLIAMGACLWWRSRRGGIKTSLYDMNGELKCLGVGAGFIVFGIGAWTLISSLATILEVYVAPKVFLVEQIARMLK